MGPDRPSSCHPPGWVASITSQGLAERADGLGGLPADVTEDGRALDPPPLPSGAVCFIDPPYVGTTGYGHDLGRSEVVAMARRWAEAGATVAISEAEPIGDLVAEGWHAVEISAMRIGQKRTFSKQQREWVTLSREPDPVAARACDRAIARAREAAAAPVSVQGDLFLPRG